MQMRQVIVSVFMVLFALLVGLPVCDFVLTYFFPNGDIKAIRQMPWVESQTELGDYTVDPKTGFRPKFGTRRANEFGCFPNGYSNVPAHPRKRLLFIGDSVAEDGYIMQGLKTLYGDQSFEYWNCGVGSFNIEQTVNFYEHYLYKTQPDHIIFILHLNDWENTPVVWANADQSISAFEPSYGEISINKFLYLHSNLYHHYLKLFFRDYRSFEAKKVWMRNQLKKLSRLTTNQKLTVLISPLALPLEKWDDLYLKLKIETVKILQNEDIRFFDLSVWLQSAVDSKVEFDGHDRWHPGPGLSRFLAKKLYQADLLVRTSSP
jgi:hypothetical protein